MRNDKFILEAKNVEYKITNKITLLSPVNYHFLVNSNITVVIDNSTPNSPPPDVIMTQILPKYQMHIPNENHKIPS